MQKIREFFSLLVMAVIAGLSGYMFLVKFAPVLTPEHWQAALALILSVSLMLAYGIWMALRRRTSDEEVAAQSEQVTAFQDLTFDNYMSTQ